MKINDGEIPQERPAVRFSGGGEQEGTPSGSWPEAGRRAARGVPETRMTADGPSGGVRPHV
jgi:hypothetical protein